MKLRFLMTIFRPFGVNDKRSLWRKDLSRKHTRNTKKKKNYKLIDKPDRKPHDCDTALETMLQKKKNCSEIQLKIVCDRLKSY